VRIVRETGKPIAQVAKDLGINAGTLANWVQMDRLAREQDTGSGGELAESEREELARLRRQKAEWAKERAELEMERGCPQALSGPLGEGSDGPVSVAAFIASQKTDHDVPHVLTCRALGVSQAWFYKWRDRAPTIRQQRQADLDVAIAAKF
jgi:transposase